MTNEEAKERARKFLEFMKLAGKTPNKYDFISDYKGSPGEAEAVWYYVDMMMET